MNQGALARGVELFNQGEFWHAHEAWEEAWLEEDDEPKRFLQGLIQVAAGYYKATVQNQPGGCVKLLTAGLAKLSHQPDSFEGVELLAFRAAVLRTLAQARRWQAGELPGLERAAIPRLAHTATSGPRAP